MSEAEGTGDIVEDLGLPSDTNTKWALAACIKAVMRTRWTTETLAAATFTQPDVLAEWLKGRVRDVSIRELVYVYNIAAKGAGAPSLARIVMAHVQMLRDQE